MAFNESKNLSGTLESTEYKNLYGDHVKEEVQDDEYNQLYDSIKKNPSELLEKSEYENQYDAHVKKEIHDEDDTQACNSIKSEQSLQLTNSKSMGSIILEKELCMSIIKNEEDEIPFCPVSVKIEISPNPEVFYDSGDTGTHYDVLVAPQKTVCKFCNKIFENSFHLYKHNIKHIQIKIELPGNNSFNKLYLKHVCSDANKHASISCKKVYKTKISLSQHIRRSHNDNGRLLDCVCGIQFSTAHALNIHRFKSTACSTKTTLNKYECGSCKKIFKIKRNLTSHIRRIHFDFGRTFDCLCGKQFKTPYALNNHRNTCNSYSTKSILGKYECDSCKKIFKNKIYLKAHIRRLHYDYGRTFTCVCGKQFTTPYALNDHRYTWHDCTTENTGSKHECESCKKVYPNKRSLTAHIRRVHHDYGRTFDCVCGKQFTSPYALNDHRFKSNRCVKPTLVKHECGSCKKVFKVKRNLTAHIKRVHYDYGRTFDCVCGKQFTSPYALNDHRYLYHGRSNETAVGEYECYSCKKIYPNRRSLTAHIKRVHFDYESTFDCVCGKQFRRPYALNKHRNTCHGCSNETAFSKYECDSCKKIFKDKRYLKAHIWRLHYDYGRTFDCVCGKQFTSPYALDNHRHKCHRRSNETDLHNLDGIFV